MGKKPQPPLTAEAAWRQLVGEWVFRQGDPEEPGGSWVESRYTFTPDRRWIWVSLLAGGILPGVQRQERAIDILNVAVDDQDVLLTLGDKANPQPASDGVMTLRFRSLHRLVVEDGHVHAWVMATDAAQVQGPG